MRAFFILKNFYLQLSKSHLPLPIWCGKRDNHFSRRKTGEHGVKRLTAKNKNWCQIGVKIEKITILRAVHKYKDSREQFERRTHKRLIDIKNPSKETIDALAHLDLPSGVDIEIKTK